MTNPLIILKIFIASNTNLLHYIKFKMNFDITSKKYTIQKCELEFDIVSNSFCKNSIL